MHVTVTVPLHMLPDVIAATRRRLADAERAAGLDVVVRDAGRLLGTEAESVAVLADGGFK